MAQPGHKAIPAVQNVHAYIVGEHGDSKIPLWSSATIGAVPVLRWNDPRLPPLTAAERDNIGRKVKQAGYQILRGKGYTNYAVALASARIIEADGVPTGCLTSPGCPEGWSSGG